VPQRAQAGDEGFAVDCVSSERSNRYVISPANDRIDRRAAASNLSRNSSCMMTLTWERWSASGRRGRIFNLQKVVCESQYSYRNPCKLFVRDLQYKKRER
jgi:hypothetical protein